MYFGIINTKLSVGDEFWVMSKDRPVSVFVDRVELMCVQKRNTEGKVHMTTNIKYYYSYGSFTGVEVSTLEAERDWPRTKQELLATL